MADNSDNPTSLSPLERAVLALAQHQDDYSDEPGINRPRTIEDIRRYRFDYEEALAGVRVVIEAIREPSQTMILRCGELHGSQREIWQRSINALLEEGR